jgi:glycerol-3-phosphate acyltransferase PlsY
MSDAGALAAGVAAIVVAYGVGTLPTAILVAGRHGVDPTSAGSGNPGATNVLETVGARAGALTLVGDLAKGAAAAGLGWAVDGRMLAVLCGAAAVLGHVAPVTRRFRGGKGVATGVGMTLATFPPAVLAGVAWFLVFRFGLGRRTVVCEMGIVALPGAAALLGATAVELAGLTAATLLVLYRLWATR